MRKTIIGLYGKTGIERVYCYKCKAKAFVLDDHLTCCNTKVEETDDLYKIENMIHKSSKRREIIGKKLKLQLLENQKACCAYCGNPLDNYYIKNGKMLRSVTHFEHFLPLCYREIINNNIYASHSICNNIKHTHIFKTVNAASVYICSELHRKKIIFTVT